MTLKSIGFTKMEADCVEHRLGLYDEIAQVFADTPDLDHFQSASVRARAKEMCDELMNGQWAIPVITVDPANRLDREILFEVIAGSTWLSNADDLTPQKANWMRRGIKRAAWKIEGAFGDEYIGTITIPD